MHVPKYRKGIESIFNLNELLTYIVFIIAGVQALPALAGKACTPAMLLF